METELAKLKELEAKAQPAPWFVFTPDAARRDDSVFHRNRTVCMGAGALGAAAIAYCDYMTPEYAEGNAAFIAALRNAAPSLLARLEAAERAVEQLRKLVDLPQDQRDWLSAALALNAYDKQVK